MNVKRGLKNKSLALAAMSTIIGSGCEMGAKTVSLASIAPSSPSSQSVGASPKPSAAPSASPIPTPSPSSSASPLPPPPADGRLPGWVNSLSLWQWYPIPNTALSSVEPSPRPFGGTGPSSKIAAWCGATLKRLGSVYMLGAAGGHGDYAGNEVDALALNTETPHWVELHGPSAAESVINAAQYFLDGRPSPTHTYYATHFINSLNRMLVFTSPGMGSMNLPAPPANWPYTGASYSFSFSLDKNEWDAPEYVATYPGIGDFTAALFAQHPFTDDVYMSKNGSDGWYKWSASSNAWTKLSNTTRAPWYAGAAIDPIRNHVLIVGGYSPTPPEVRDLNGNQINVQFTGSAASTLSNITGYPAVIYDEANDDFLVIANADPIQVYRVNASTFAVDVPVTTGSAPAVRQNGIQNSAQYVPELRGIVMANSYNGNVYFMRTSP